MLTDLQDFSVFRCLHGMDVPLQASARFGGGVAAAFWHRNETAMTRYDNPNHHTLSLYVAGGEQIRRHRGHSLQDSPGAGSLCLMPAGVDSVWDVDGQVSLFHLYVPQVAFDRVVVETLDANPAAVRLRDESFFRDPTIETVIRSAVLPLNWEEPAERVAVGHAGHMLMAYLAARFAERGQHHLQRRGGLSPSVQRRIFAFIADHLDQPLGLEALAQEAGLSPFHFARMFKQSTGESPHAYLLRQRIERGRALIDQRKLGLAEIALACGFSSQSHFTARFRQGTGLTPREYAETHCG